MRKWAWNKIIAIIRTWYESFLAVLIGLHIKEFANLGLLRDAFIAAAVPVTLRWLNPKDNFPGEQ